MREDSAVILFDGVCNLCNASVNFVIRHDKRSIFRFASLQSAPGQQLAGKYPLAEKTDSFVLLDGGKAYTRSAAALRVLKMLGFPWSASYAFIIIPSFIRDAVYNLVSRNRYRFFGKRDTCMVPTPELKEKFLD